jgi:AcrR family transcriptional regulator
MMQTKTNSRKIQAEERRRQILETALNVFGTRGFQGTSIKDIAKAAGISQGLMYHYFASKEELLKAIIEYFGFLPQLKILLADSKDLAVSHMFEKIANGFLDVLESKRMLVSILIREVDSSVDVAKAWADLCHEGVALIQEYLETHIQNGDLRPHNTEVTARSVFGMMFMFHFTQGVFQFSQVNRETFIQEALYNTLHGIGQE